MGYYECSSPSFKSKCLFTVFFVGILTLFGWYVKFSFEVKNVWVNTLGIAIFLINFACLELIYVKNASNLCLKKMQVKIMQGDLKSVFYFADEWASALMVGYIWFFNYWGYNFFSAIKYYSLICSLLIGIILPLICFTLIMRNVGVTKARIVSFFRIIIYDTIVYMGIVFHVVVLWCMGKSGWN